MSRATPMPGVPAAMACPFCGGYVRGHMWIAADGCSVSVIDWEPLPNDNLPAGCMRCGDAHACPNPLNRNSGVYVLPYKEAW